MFIFFFYVYNVNESKPKDALPFTVENFFHVRAFEDKEVYSKSRLRDRTPKHRADF